jgi:very-short-patch-repair endonuclease
MLDDTTTPPLGALIRLARKMRREPEPSEALLWAQLRGGKLGVRFRRQHPFAIGFIVDFFAASARLVVEVDGGYHRRGDVAADDAKRQREIEAAYGVRFLRLEAELVERDVFAAVACVQAALHR